MLIDTFKEMTNHMEDHCCLEDIMEVREFFTKKIIESKNKAASVLTDSNNDDSKYVSVALPSSKKRKIHGMKNYRNYNILYDTIWLNHYVNYRFHLFL